MVKLKKVLVMAILFVMAMTAFVACGGDKESTESGGNGSNGGNSEEQLPVGGQGTAEEWNAATAATASSAAHTARHSRHNRTDSARFSKPRHPTPCAMKSN